METEEITTSEVDTQREKVERVQEEFKAALELYSRAKESLTLALRGMHTIGEYPSPPEGVRFKLPDERDGKSHGFKLGQNEGLIKHYIQTGTYTDGRPGEMFLTADKEGSLVSGLMDSFATLFSIALQYGVPLDRLVEKFKFVRFEPCGYTTNKKIRNAHSMIDYVFRWLELKYLVKEEEDGTQRATSSDPD